MESNNLVTLHRTTAARLGPRIALRWKQDGLWHDVSWRSYWEQTVACAAALIDAGVQPGDRVGVVSENRVEWLIADMGVMAAGAVNVPPHAPLTAAQIRYQLHDAGVVWAIVSTAEQADKICEIKNNLPKLRGVVVFDTDAVQQDFLSWRGFLQRGRAALSHVAEELGNREASLNEQSLATVMYTSGTTGEPKGVMLTHGNLLSNAVAVNDAYPRGYDSILLNWLPFSHIYARTVDHYLSIVAGVVLCLADSVDTIVANMMEVHPTHMSSVPRFYEKLLTAVADDDPKVAHARLRGAFGSRIEWLTSGGAPLPLSVAEAYRDAGLLVLQGYGLTECAPVISFNQPDAYKLASVGRAVPGVEIRISDEGEILTRGPHVMPGYWNNPEASAEAVRDEWLYTGDLGHLDEDGYLFITGRKKELIVTSSGKNISPNQIEGLVLADPCIDQITVIGDNYNYLTALVVPSWPNLRQAHGGEASKSDEELADDDDVNAWLLERIDGLLQDVASWERVRKIAILPRPFSIEGDELTVSLKLRRNVIAEKYKQRIATMYE